MQARLMVSWQARSSTVGIQTTRGALPKISAKNDQHKPDTSTRIFVAFPPPTFHVPSF